MLNRTLTRILFRRLRFVRPVLGGLVLMVAFLFAWEGAAATYVVKRGDTLHGIAKSQGVPLATLAEQNGLSRNNHVYIGQRLNLPPRQQPRSFSKSSGTPNSVQRAIDQARVSSGRWKYIVIHHSGVGNGTVKSMDHYHREVRHMENGIAYHFVIGNGQGMGDGEIAVCPRWTKQLAGGHLASEAQNSVALGICLVGNFDKSTPTPGQMKSLRSLSRSLMARCRLSPNAVKTHQQINVVHTRCPGTRFPSKEFQSSIKGP